MDVYESGLISETPHSKEDIDVKLRKGQWNEEEDMMLKAYVNIHGEGSWNSVASLSGLKRSGKSCRLRWMNYLRPQVIRGNISLQEQLLILQLHSRWGNRWSKIAQHLPGRTDNEIKNYWRTRVQKQAKQLKCDVNSKQFRDAVRYVWIPRLIERIYASSESSSVQLQPMGGICSNTGTSQITHAGTIGSVHNVEPSVMENISNISQVTHANTIGSLQIDTSVLPELTGTSDVTYAPVCSVPDLTGCYNELKVSNYPNKLHNGSDLCSENLASKWNTDDEVGFQATLDGGDWMENVWNEENIWLLRHQLYDGDDMN